MKVFKITVMTVIFIFSVSLLIASAASQPEGKVFNWRCQSKWSPTDQCLLDYQAMFDRVKEATGGKLSIKIFPSGAILSMSDVADALAAGTIEMAVSSGVSWSGRMPLAFLEEGVPMAYGDSYEPYYFWYDKKYRFIDQLRKAYQTHNVYPISIFTYQSGLVLTKPVNSLDDFKGLKLRIVGLQAELMKRLGAQPVNIPAQEIYTALATGVIDGAKWGAELGAYQMKLHEVAKYILDPHIEEGSMNVLYANLARWNSLPEEFKDILWRFSQNEGYWQTGQYVIGNKQARAAMVKSGSIVSKLSDNDVSKMRSIAASILDDIGKKGPDAEKGVLLLKDYLKDLGHLK